MKDYKVEIEVKDVEIVVKDEIIGELKVECVEIVKKVMLDVDIVVVVVVCKVVIDKVVEFIDGFKDEG